MLQAHEEWLTAWDSLRSNRIDFANSPLIRGLRPERREECSRAALIARSKKTRPGRPASNTEECGTAIQGRAPGEWPSVRSTKFERIPQMRHRQTRPRAPVQVP